MFWYFFQDLNIRFYLAQRIVWPTLFLPLMDLKGAFSPNKNTNPTKGLSTPNLVQNTRELIPNVFNKDLKKKHQRLHLLKVVQNIVWYSIVKQVVVLWVSFLKQKHTHTHTHLQPFPEFLLLLDPSVPATLRCWVSSRWIPRQNILRLRISGGNQSTFSRIMLEWNIYVFFFKFVTEKKVVFWKLVDIFRNITRFQKWSNHLFWSLQLNSINFLMWDSEVANWTI